MLCCIELSCVVVVLCCGCVVCRYVVLSCVGVCVCV